MRTVLGWVLTLLLVVAAGVGVVSTVWSRPGVVYGTGMLNNVRCVQSDTDGEVCGGLVPADPSITDQIVLSTTRVVSGEPLRAVLVVTNHSAEPVVVQRGLGCPDFVVALTNSKIPPEVAFAVSCQGELRFEPGVTRFTYPVFSTYDGCAENPADARPAEGVVACLPGGRAPPLPAGTYEAVLIGDGNVALPPAVSPPVTLIAPRADSTGQSGGA